MMQRIVSGGQTGVDRAALDAATEMGIDYGGWCPKGRRAEDGRIPARYAHLQEADTSNYSERTERNVINSDGTLITYMQNLAGGTRLTLELAKKYKKPFYLIDLANMNKYSLIWSSLGLQRTALWCLIAPVQEKETAQAFMK